MPLLGDEGLFAHESLYMRAFAEAWTDPEIVQRVVGRLPWGRNIGLLTKTQGHGSPALVCRGYALRNVTGLIGVAEYRICRQCAPGRPG